jgi:hypothetical protein
VLIWALDSEFCQAALRISICDVGIDYLLNPGWLHLGTHLNRHEVTYTRQSISGHIFHALAIRDAELQSHEFGHGLALERRLKILVIEVTETVMISLDQKFCTL